MLILLHSIIPSMFARVLLYRKALFSPYLCMYSFISISLELWVSMLISCLLSVVIIIYFDAQTVPHLANGSSFKLALYWHVPIICWALYSGTVRRSQLTVYFPCPSSGLSHFSSLIFLSWLLLGWNSWCHLWTLRRQEDQANKLRMT